MNIRQAANTPARNTSLGPTIAARVPEEWRRLLEATQARRGDPELSETIREAVRLLIVSTLDIDLPPLPTSQEN